MVLLKNLIWGQNQTYDILGERYIYRQPKFFDFISNTPAAFENFGNAIFNNNSLSNELLILASSAILIVKDEEIYKQFSRLGRTLGIGNGDNTKTMIAIGNYPIFRGPTDLGSAMYFIGDGWTHIGLSLSFLTAGLINGDNRALQTSSEIAQVVLTAGIITQLLKHITGRETPIRATQPGGIWRFFPNQIDYHKNVPKYDAFPSGHLAVAFGVLCVIADNYSE